MFKKKKRQLGSKSKHHAEKNVAHFFFLLNQMPYIKYSKLQCGFKSVPRKKDTFKKTILWFIFDPLLERTEVHGGQPHKCSNLEQITLEMGEPELSVTKLNYQIRNLIHLKYDCPVTDSSPISIWHPAINTSDIKKYLFLKC